MFQLLLEEAVGSGNLRIISSVANGRTKRYRELELDDDDDDAIDVTTRPYFRLYIVPMSRISHKAAHEI